MLCKADMFVASRAVARLSRDARLPCREADIILQRPQVCDHLPSSEAHQVRWTAGGVGGGGGGGVREGGVAMVTEKL